MIDIFYIVSIIKVLEVYKKVSPQTEKVEFTVIFKVLLKIFCCISMYIVYLQHENN